jgi:membrane protein
LSFAFLVSLLLSVWTANAGMKALFDGLNIAYEEREKRNFFHLTLLTYAFTFGALVFMAIVAGLLVATPLALAYVGISEEAPAWLALRWLILFAVGVAVFSVVYRYGPCRRRARWRWVTFGAIFAAGFWLLGSLGFSFYVNGFARYDATYGSLGAVIGFMMWIWVSVLIVLVGAKLNAEIEHQTARDSTEGLEKPMGRRGAVVADTVGLSAPKRLHAILGRIGAAVSRRQPNSSSSVDRRAA